MSKKKIDGYYQVLTKSMLSKLPDAREVCEGGITEDIVFHYHIGWGPHDFFVAAYDSQLDAVLTFDKTSFNLTKVSELNGVRIGFGGRIECIEDVDKLIEVDAKQNTCPLESYHFKKTALKDLSL